MGWGFAVVHGRDMQGRVKFYKAYLITSGADGEMDERFGAALSPLRKALGWTWGADYAGPYPNIIDFHVVFRCSRSSHWTSTR